MARPRPHASVPATRRVALPRRGGRNRAGLTLIEAGLCTVIVGVGILALVRLMATLTLQTAAAARMTTAMFLADNVQEAMADLPFRDPSGPGFGLEEPGEPLARWDDIDDFDGFDSAAATVAPVDSTGAVLPELARYVQRVRVEHVSTDRLTSVQAGTDAARVTVTVFYRTNPGDPNDPGQPLHQASWVRMRR